MSKEKFVTPSAFCPEVRNAVWVCVYARSAVDTGRARNTHVKEVWLRSCLSELVGDAPGGPWEPSYPFDHASVMAEVAS